MELNEFRKASKILIDEFLDLRQEYLEMEEEFDDLTEAGEAEEADKQAREMEYVETCVEDVKKQLLRLIEGA
jgi:hypothetical protein